MRFIASLPALAISAIVSLGAVPGHAAPHSIFRIEIERLTADQFSAGSGVLVPEDELATFSGHGLIRFSPSATTPGHVLSLSLSLATLGTDSSNESGIGAETIHRFLYDETDITGAIDLDTGGSALRGVLDFSGLPGKASQSGEVVLQDLLLDFDGGRATGFCFSGGGGPGTAECIRGGGTSTGIEAGVSSIVVPLPPAFALLALPLMVLLGLARFGRDGRRAAARL